MHLVLAALGAHFGVYHLATSAHSQGGNYVGLDATQRAVIQPVLGFLQVLALVLAVVALVLVAVRWRHASTGTAIAFATKSKCGLCAARNATEYPIVSPLAAGISARIGINHA